MRPAREALRGAPLPRILYTDLDGTLLGPGGSLFATPRGGVSLAAADALAALHEAGVSVVPVSGRTADQVWEVARVVGATDFIAEMGGVLSLERDADRVRLDGAFTGRGTPHEAMLRSGAPGLLLEVFTRRLEPHAPWAFLPRTSSMLFRGHVDLAEAAALLDDAGYGWLALADNGVIPRPFPGLDVDEVHAYHLLPKGVTKTTGVAAHRDRRGVATGACLAVGDAPSDAEVAGEVAAVAIVANGRKAVEASGAQPENVVATDGSHGAGFAEVVRALLG